MDIDITDDIWRNRLQRAYTLATQSPDPSSQNGALIYGYTQPAPWEGTGKRESLNVIGLGFNGFTPGIQPTPDKLERPIKYLYVEHAERAAVYDLIGSTVEPEVMVCPWASCADCARAIALSGIGALVRHKDAMERKADRWAESIKLADTILAAAGVEVYEYVGPVGGPQIMHLEELWTP
jgi:deoxycytidylate deaminase